MENFSDMQVLKNFSPLHTFSGSGWKIRPPPLNCEVNMIEGHKGHRDTNSNRGQRGRTHPKGPRLGGSQSDWKSVMQKTDTCDPWSPSQPRQIPHWGALFPSSLVTL